MRMKPAQIRLLESRLTALLSQTGATPGHIQSQFYIGDTHKVVTVPLEMPPGTIRSFAVMALDIERAIGEGTRIRSLHHEHRTYQAAYSVTLELDLTFWLKPSIAQHDAVLLPGMEVT